MSCSVLGLQPSFGFGDRIGLATPGHVRAMLNDGQGISAIFPQQSIREMTRTQRTATAVMSDAITAARAAGWTGEIGADADHLKTTADIELTAAAGFTFFTLDPSGRVDRDADRNSLSELEEKYRGLAPQLPWVTDYVNRVVTLANGTRIQFDRVVCLRAAVKYGLAIELTKQLADDIRRVQTAAGKPYEVELSVDETDHPTTVAEHFIIADQCLRHGIPLVSLAPRFVGDFEKGVDFKGDFAAFESSLDDHAAVARLLGPYKLSLHSGSDKLSVYTALARRTTGQFHVKTAGTSYLEAVRVVCRRNEQLFRSIVSFSRSRYDTDKATYHVSATLADVPGEAEIADPVQLEQAYLERWETVPEGRGFTQPGRQILHCTFGSVLTHPEFGPAIRNELLKHSELYAEVLADHFGRHLRALRRGMTTA